MFGFYDFSHDLKSRLEAQKIFLDAHVFGSLKTYADELLKWNKVHNLSGASSMESVADNIFDSLYPLKFIAKFSACLDVGSGGGFPALPLAIARPDAFFHLVEPRTKRASFLQNITAELGLKNVRVYEKRLENLLLSEIGSVDLVTSRAAMSVAEISHFCHKFLSSQGYFLLYKGSNLQTELPNLSVEECFKRGERIYYYKQN